MRDVSVGRNAHLLDEGSHLLQEWFLEVTPNSLFVKILKIDFFLQLMEKRGVETAHNELALLIAIVLLIVDVLIVSLDGIGEGHTHLSLVQVLVDLPHLAAELVFRLLHVPPDVSDGIDQVGEPIGQYQHPHDEEGLVHGGGGGQRPGRDHRQHHVTQGVDISH